MRKRATNMLCQYCPRLVKALRKRWPPQAHKATDEARIWDFTDTNVTRRWISTAPPGW